jgi:hypothetical protein
VASANDVSSFAHHALCRFSRIEHHYPEVYLAFDQANKVSKVDQAIKVRNDGNSH